MHDFIKQVVSCIKEKLGPEYIVESKVVPKTNDVIKHGIIIRLQEQRIAPCIYIDSYYDTYEKGSDTIENIAENIICTYRQNTVQQEDFSIDCFSDFDGVRSKICGRLLNRETNSKLISNHPHREYLDLVLTYYVEVSDFFSDGYATIHISNEHIKMWGVSEEDLYNQMMENMRHTGESIKMYDLISEIGGDSLGEIDDVSMYVITNKNRLHGAVHMMDADLLKATADKMQGDFYIIPSSIHETIAIKKNSDNEATDLQNMVQTVNDTELEPSERLSYHLYLYHAEDGKVTIAA